MYFSFQRDLIFQSVTNSTNDDIVKLRDFWDSNYLQLCWDNIGIQRNILVFKVKPLLIQETI